MEGVAIRVVGSKRLLAGASVVEPYQLPLRRNMSIATKWYVRVTKKDHHRADSIGTVRRSVLVMEAYLGRYLLPEEEVHHTNGVITDDRLENLELTTHSEHATKPKHGFYEYNHNPRNTKGRPFYGNQYRRLTAKAV